MTLTKITPLNARKPISNTSVVDVGYEHGSPLCQLFDDYRAWKQDRQDVAMPDADSSLDEKLTYVCEHYADASDGLSLFDALSTMKELGVISQIEYAWALGGPLIRIPITEMENPSFTIINDGERGDRTRWDIPFMTSPLVSFHSLDDIFNWLEEFRKEDHPLFVSLEEARRMGITRL